MLHTFKPGTIDAAKCVHCKRTTEMHNCDICGAENISVTLKYGNMLLCGPCEIEEERLYAESQRPENVAARVETQQKAAEINAVLKQAAAIDDSIEIKSDIFNAETVALEVIRTSIDADGNIENKPYALGEQVKAHFEKLRDTMFDLNKQMMEVAVRQKATQVYLNQLANKLRADEREKLKISDLNYQPKPVKSSTPKPIKTTGTSKKAPKLDKTLLRKYAAELGVAEFTLQMLVVSKGLTIEAAANLLRVTINAAKAGQ